MKRRKLLIYLAGFIFLVTGVCVVGLIYFNDQALLQSNYLHYSKEDQTYYRQLNRQCFKKESAGCCITSVRQMMVKHAQLVPPEGCADGFVPNMLRCPDSFRWCEKKNGQ